MKLNPKMDKGDRIGSVIGGIGMVVYALISDFDRSWVRIIPIVVGVAFMVGGFGGT